MRQRYLPWIRKNKLKIRKSRLVRALHSPVSTYGGIKKILSLSDSLNIM
ncbi:hypothetical protein BVI1335_1650018 [Burkholderia vietnamiensis]|nr:hypothetical protein BVI1335_1650018 [Burkholderia vietnamiensis]